MPPITPARAGRLPIGRLAERTGVHLETIRYYERIGLENRYGEILGVSIPQVVVPLFPGKNITVISEVIALNFMLKIYGYDAAQVLNERILDTMRASDRLRKYLEQDRE